MEGKGYICRRCDTRYTLLESSFLFHPDLNAFFCEHCTSASVPAELEYYENTNSGSGSAVGGGDPEGLFSKFMIMSAPMIDMLKKTDQLTIPSFHLSDYIESANQAAQEANEENAIHIITTEDALQSAASAHNNLIEDSAIKENITVDIQATEAATEPTNYEAFYSNSVQSETSPKETNIEIKEESKVDADEPRVSVNGDWVPLSQIDDVLMEKMTTEEYEEYYRILSSQ